MIMYKDVVMALSEVPCSQFPVRLRKATKISTGKSWAGGTFRLQCRNAVCWIITCR